MKAKKRNTFWTFCFSFVPGCAEMYWGFMRAGISLLIPFMGLIFITYLLEMPVFMFFDVVVYLYAFFHARNMAHLTEEEVQEMEDGRINMLEGLGVPPGIIQKHHLAEWAGILLIVFGTYNMVELFYKNVALPYIVNMSLHTFLHSFPQVVTAIILIILGIKLITGKKKELEEEIEGGEEEHE